MAGEWSNMGSHGPGVEKSACSDPGPGVEVGGDQPPQGGPGEGGDEAEAEDEHDVEHQELDDVLPHQSAVLVLTGLHSVVWNTIILLSYFYLPRRKGKILSILYIL